MTTRTHGLFRRLPFCLLLAFSSIGARAVTVDNFVARIYTNAQGTLPYRLFIPTNYHAGTKLPLVLFLHGAGERGSDNRLQLTGQTGELVFASETNQLKYPSFMVAPQCPLSGVWADTTRRAQVLGLMNALQTEFTLDADRLYITGLSMGGIGTWDYISRFTNMYAAAIPMSGSGTPSLASRIIQVPIWNFHAANDDTVNVSGSRTMISAVRRAGGNPAYTEYATGGHPIWTPAYNTPILMDWVYAQKRGAAATNAPLLTITAPTMQATFSSTNVGTLNLAGTASDGHASVTLVTWTNFQSTTFNGVASGTTNWSVTNVSLNSSLTNFVLVTGFGTSWYPSLGGNTTFNDTLTVIFPPVITSQPQGQFVNQGENVTFHVSLASNRALPKYQWSFNGANLIGRTTDSLSVTNVQYTNAGAYSVQVSNLFASIVSSNAVLSVNRPPVADSQSISVDEDTPLAITLTASDPDGDVLTYSVAHPSHGTLTGVAPNLVYLPSTNYNGQDSFSFHVSDGRINSTEATVSIHVLPVNDAPVAGSQSVSVNEDTPVAITLAASDVDGDPLTYSVTPPAHGTLTGVAPNLTYLGHTNYFGQDSFTFKVNDGQLDSEPATVSISVAPVNDPPVAVATISPLFRLSEDQTDLLVLSLNNTNATVIFDGSLSSDVENDPLQFSWVEQGVGLLATGVLATNVLEVGPHTVALVVSDGTDQTTNIIRFQIITPAQAVADLVALVDDAAIARQHKHPLMASLNVAMASFDRGSFGAGINQLGAFQNKVEAQIAPDYPAVAEALIQAAQAVMDLLSGSDAGPSSRPVVQARGQINSLLRHADGSSQLRFTGAPGLVYLIEASADLVNWETIGTASELEAGSFEFEDAATIPSRFYRVTFP
jgi:poly(3-hydroxybutyrate) depolymerase